MLKPMPVSNAKAGVEFLRTEFETTSVFAKIAADAADPDKRLRNIQNARKGYDTLVHFVQTLHLSSGERREMQTKISELRRKLISLGERV